MAHAIQQLIARGYRAKAKDAPEAGAAAEAKPETIAVTLKQGGKEVEIEVAKEDVPIAQTINAHAASNASPDLSFGVSEADTAALKALNAARAAGEDVFGDDEPINEFEAAERGVAWNPGEQPAKVQAAAEDESTDEEAEGDPQPSEEEGSKGGETDASPEEPSADEVAAQEAPLAEQSESKPAVAAAPAAPVASADEQAILALPSARLLKVEDSNKLADAREVLEAKIDDIETKWQSNQLTDEQRVAELKIARRELNDTLVKIAKNESAIETNEVNSVAAASQVVDAIKGLAKREKSLDYDADEAACADFNETLQVISRRADSAKLSFAQIALKTHRTVLAMRGIAPAKAAAVPIVPAAQAKPAAKPATAAAPAKRAAPAAPPTIRNLPNAATSHTGGGRMDQLGRLKGLDYQAAWSRLSDSERSALLDD